MQNCNKAAEELFWSKVLHRAEMQLMDMNIGDFHLWRKKLGDERINWLLTHMKPLLSLSVDRDEVIDFWCDIHHAPNMAGLLSCFGCSGKVIAKMGAKGDIYCIPVLYIVISYLINKTKVDFSFHHYKSVQDIMC